MSHCEAGRIFADVFVFHGFISFARRRPERGGDSSEVSNPSCKDWGHPILYSCLFCDVNRVFLAAWLALNRWTRQPANSCRPISPRRLMTVAISCQSHPRPTGEWLCFEGCLVCHRLASVVSKCLIFVAGRQRLCPRRRELPLYRQQRKMPRTLRTRRSA